MYDKELRVSPYQYACHVTTENCYVHWTCFGLIKEPSLLPAKVFLLTPGWMNGTGDYRLKQPVFKTNIKYVYYEPGYAAPCIGNLAEETFPVYIVTCFARQRDKNNVGSSDLTRKFIGTIAEVTSNSYNTHSFAFDSTQTHVFQYHQL
jgi:hypothetical protein